MMQAPDPAAAQAALKAALGHCGLDQAAINAVVTIGGIAKHRTLEIRRT